jgi:hypothetical protein
MRAVQVALRLLIGFAGGYAAAAGFVALAAVAMAAAAPSARSEAAVLSAMLAFPVHLVLLIWAFAEPWPCRRSFLIVGAGILCWVGSWLAAAPSGL